MQSKTIHANNMTIVSNLPRILDFAQELIQKAVKKGDCVVDATMGNGHDTLFLAQCVGDHGTVHAFDIQPQALDNTQRLLQKTLPSYSHCHLHLASHDQLTQYVQQPCRCIVFNLGYLPKADKALTTVASTTLSALSQSLTLLQPLGLLVMVIYTGHPAGVVESEAIENWLHTLSPNDYRVIRYCVENRISPCPYLVAIEKMG